MISLSPYFAASHNWTIIFQSATEDKHRNYRLSSRNKKLHSIIRRCLCAKYKKMNIEVSFDFKPFVENYGRITILGL